MNNLKRMSYEEYRSLKNEIIDRLNSFSNQGSGILTSVLAIWTVCFSIFAINYQFLNLNTQMEFFLQIVQLLLYSLPILVILPVSYRIGDHLSQITTISAYIKIFYEIPSIIATQNGKACDIYAWEICNEQISSLKMHSGKATKTTKFICLDFFGMSCFSTLLMILFSIIELSEYFRQGLWIYFVIFLSVSIISLVFMCIGVYNIWKASSVKINISKRLENYKIIYFNQAIKMGFVSEEDKKVYYELLGIESE